MLARKRHTAYLQAVLLQRLEPVWASAEPVAGASASSCWQQLHCHTVAVYLCVHGERTLQETSQMLSWGTRQLPGS